MTPLSPDAPPPPAQIAEAGPGPELTRDVVCRCTRMFTQTGLSMPITGGAGFWHPRVCAVCQAEDAERQARAAAAAAEARATYARDTRLRALEVPPDYAGASFGSWEFYGSADQRAKHGHAVQVARRFVAAWPDVPTFLAFAGGPGTGKGHLVWAIAKDAVRQHAAGVGVVKLANLVRELRASWRPTGPDPVQSEAAVLARYRGVDLLVIDEVSHHAFYGQRIHQHLYDVVDHRIEWRRPTILTTNESDAELATILGPALWDRLQGNGGHVDFGSESYRLLDRADRSAAA